MCAGTGKSIVVISVGGCSPENNAKVLSRLELALKIKFYDRDRPLTDQNETQLK